MNSSLRSTTYVTVLVAITVAFFRLASVIMIPLIFSILLSYLVHPSVQWMQQLRFRIWGKEYPLHPGIAILFSLLFVYAILSGFIYLFFNELAVLITDLPKYQARITALFLPLQEGYQHLAQRFATKGQPTAEIPFGQTLTVLLGHLPALFGGITELMVDLILIFFLSFFMLMYSSSLTDQFIRMVPREQRGQIKEMFDRLSEVMQQFLFGMAMAQLSVAVAVWFGLWAIGIQYAFLWGIFSGVLRVIPVVGLIAS